VDLVRTYVSEEYVASIVRVKGISAIGPAVAVTRNSCVQLLVTAKIDFCHSDDIGDMLL
jgi:hypothetical protein